MAIHTQICTIGAGSAGATTALFLAKAGIPHIIVDAAQFATKAAEKEQYDASMFVGYEQELYRSKGVVEYGNA